MRKLVILGLALVPVTSATAQSHISLIAGVVSAKVAVSSEGTTITPGSRTGFAAGIGMASTIGKDIEFAPEALYVQKGFDFTGGGSEDIGKIGYIEVPILFRVTFGTGETRPFIMAGPGLALKASCSEEIKDGSTTSTNDCKDSNGKSTIKTFDVGAIVGAGVTYREWGISARYDLGLTNILENATAGVSQKNRAWLLLVSFSPK